MTWLATHGPDNTTRWQAALLGVPLGAFAAFVVCVAVAPLWWLMRIGS